MLDKKSVYDQTTEEYLTQIGNLDLHQVSENKGAVHKHGALAVPLLGQWYTIRPAGIEDSLGKKPDPAIRVVLCRYLLHHNPRASESDQWASFKDFPDAAPLVGAFRSNAEQAVADDFAHRLDDLAHVSSRLGGQDAAVEGSYDLKIRFHALPRVPVLLLFNDADEEFPARCLQLFQRRVEKYLDMESLAILGWVLADYLRGVRPIEDGVG